MFVLVIVLVLFLVVNEGYSISVKSEMLECAAVTSLVC